MLPARSESSASVEYPNELAREMALFEQKEREEHRREVGAFLERNRAERERLGLRSPPPNPPSFIPDPSSPLNSNQAVLPAGASKSVISSSRDIDQDTFVDVVVDVRRDSGMRTRWLVANKGVCEKCAQTGTACTNSGAANISCIRCKDHRIKCSRFRDYEVDMVADRLKISVEESGKLWDQWGKLKRDGSRPVQRAKKAGGGKGKVVGLGGEVSKSKKKNGSNAPLGQSRLRPVPPESGRPSAVVVESLPSRPGSSRPPAVIIKTLPRIRIPARPLAKPLVQSTTSTPPPRVPEKRGREDSDEDGASSSDVPAVKRLRRKVPHPPRPEVRVTPTSDEEVESSLIRRPVRRIRTPPPPDSTLFVRRSSSPFGMPGTPPAVVPPALAALAGSRTPDVRSAAPLVPEGDLIDFMGSSPSPIPQVSLRPDSMAPLIPATNEVERLREQLKEVETERDVLRTRVGELEVSSMELQLRVGALEMERDHLRGVEHSLQNMDIRLGTAERERDNFETSLAREQDFNREARRFYDKWGDEDLVALEALRRVKLESGEGPDAEGGLFERNAVLEHRIQELTKIVDKLRDENRALLMDGKVAVRRGVQRFRSVMSEYELRLAGVLARWRVQSDKRLEYNVRSIQEAMRKSLVEEAADPSVLFPVHSVPMFERDYGLRRTPSPVADDEWDEKSGYEGEDEEGEYGIGPGPGRGGKYSGLASHIRRSASRGGE
ncbi:hypothetical protein Hypma_006053 [Hypsizygus marmoreus]|uniref:Uncharacterized protein n=1 Tax=Hypsizygus marmoreus TaxID=39966 RepID=A0A369JVV4_HYPMA|nr:hypothetical protein Hypma_006053 [Hypsizygus marmoreus]